MQHFRSYKSVPQISQLSDRITSLKKHLETCVLRELENGFNLEGGLVGQSWLLHDACLVASVLGDATKYVIYEIPLLQY